MVSIIVAVAKDNIIGGENRLLWHIREDLMRFKAITMGHPVVMGRKTWESLGRPLPGRPNVVISRDGNYNAEGAQVVTSLSDAIALFPQDEEVFVIGGGEIYRQAMDGADKLYMTYVDADYNGDTYFPAVDPGQWHETFSEHHDRGQDYPHPFRFVNYERTKSH